MNFSENVIDALKQSQTKYLTESQIFKILGCHSTFEKSAVTKVLDNLKQNGTLIFDGKLKKWVLSENAGLLKGHIEGNIKGFGFFINDDKISPDLFVSPKNLKGAFNADIVLVKQISSNARGEAEVIKIVEHTIKEVVGTVDKKGKTMFVKPIDKRFYQDIYIPIKKDMKALDKQKVLVKLLSYGSREAKPEGEIIKVIGYDNQKGTDILSLAYSYGLSDVFPKAVSDVAKNLPKNIESSDIYGRKDFRKKVCFTIDGSDARDFDDAVSIEKDSKGNYLLGVHIADVCNYVKHNSALDKEAFKRATSVYFPEMVFPMLPVELSNGICSLNPNVDRLTISVMMKISNAGKVVSFEIFESVINSKYRLTYDEVTSVINGDKNLTEKYKDITKDIFMMKDLSITLSEKRANKGTIEFDSSEVKFVMDENGKVTDILPYERTISHKLIEEFMILTNETVADYVFRLELPFIYRVHEKPSEEKVLDLKTFLAGVGFKLNTNSSEGVHSSSLKEVLLKAEGTPFYNIVNRVILRSMKKAKYSPDNIGHFGLTSNCYCHFTSPIRRYPDLVVHRILKLILNGRMLEAEIAKFKTFVAEAATYSSEKEIKADEVEREVDDLKKTEFAKTLEGQSFDGVISGVTNFGIFVELYNTIEGLVRLENLPDKGYTFDEKNYRLSGSSTAYHLGDKIKIVIFSADIETRKIEFLLDKNIKK